MGSGVRFGGGKRQSKRQTTKLREKIKKKVRDHGRKLKKDIKKHPEKYRKSKKDPGVPNDHPFKEQILSEARDVVAKHKEYQERRRIELKEYKAKAKENLAHSLKGQSLEALMAKAQHKAKVFDDGQGIQESAVKKGLSDKSAKAYYKEFRKVVDAADVVLEVLDARDPMGSRCKEVEEAVMSGSKAGKRLVLVLNKADLVPRENLLAWMKHLRNEYPTIPFKASTQQTARLGQAKINMKQVDQVLLQTSKCVGADILLSLLANYCRNKQTVHIMLSQVRTAVRVPLRRLSTAVADAGAVAPKPAVKPDCAKFSSGPCKKRPGYTVAGLAGAALGRSHRHKIGKDKLAGAINLTRDLLEPVGLPADYHIGIVPASDTGAVEMAMWSLLGPKPVTCIHFESFGGDWYTDITKQLKLTNVTNMQGDYGVLPDFSKVDFSNDVVFTANGTTSGVRVPADVAIPADREGLTICDATSAVFAQHMPWDRLDVVTFSWQKCLGGEGAHGMLILSPRAVERLESYTPPWPMPKIFRMTKSGKLNAGIFKGETINTPSLLATEDYIDALEWSKSVGGYEGLVGRSNANLAVLEQAVAELDWLDFLSGPDPTVRSNTSVCLTVSDLDAAGCKKMAALLEAEGVALDIGAYRTAPPGFRIWCGPTVDTADVAALVPWMRWAHDEVKASA